MRFLKALLGQDVANPSPQAEWFDLIEQTQLICRIGADRTILSVNDRFAQAMGYTRAQLEGSDYARLLREKDRKSAEYKALWGDLERGAPAQVIRPRLDAKGDERWLDINYLPRMGADGTLQDVLLLASDITEFHLRRRDNRSKVDALSRSMAVIEFDLSGKVLNANTHFLNAMGYRLEEIKGKHHRIFMPEGEAEGPQYDAFWSDLAKGASRNGPVRRMTKSGEICWLEATYETLIDPEGRPFKVVKYAFDITSVKNMEAESRAKIDAIEKVQAVIEFDPQGTILEANALFCNVMGYTRDEIVGKKHRIFIEDEVAKSAEYAAFWEDLRAGKTLAKQYRRVGKGGRLIFIDASYNPIMDASGRVVKVVKFAVDMTTSQLAIEQVGGALSKMAEGDLSARIETNLGPMDDIRTIFNRALEQVERAIGSVCEGAAEVVREAQAIRASSNELSRRTETQAATLEQSAAALEQLTGSVSGSTELTNSARGQVGSAAEEADHSARIVDNAIVAMNEIAASSQKISSITGVIDDIAFQTNLLALNAGVEAARAGDAGRGFAVVASEVRALAQRSSEAAKEIADLLVNSERQVSEGVDLVDKTGAALKRINQRVAEIRDSVVTIATSASEQSNGLAEMNKAVSDLDHTTQQNAAMAEETNAAVMGLTQKLEEVLQEVAFFTTNVRAEIDEPTRLAG
ncbi:chemotaxis protein [Thioclava dalianensis]|uniref:Chemotaxis protein n=2 Tax=Thioclava dalianensis TaxID=1185766 RepID=A0A074TL84_9RHOB|nr:chemotaxis protein [Thioclava dalianensis]SFN14193.1 methyl-accepting chemotaxis sensory transducer with Pas/Pac sensor [Thioclava dalianensis]